MQSFLIPGTGFVGLGILLLFTSNRLDVEIPTLLHRTIHAINLLTEDGTLLWVIAAMLVIPILAIPIGWHADHGWHLARTPQCC